MVHISEKIAQISANYTVKRKTKGRQRSLNWCMIQCRDTSRAPITLADNQGFKITLHTDPNSIHFRYIFDDKYPTVAARPNNWGNVTKWSVFIPDDPSIHVCDRVIAHMLYEHLETIWPRSYINELQLEGKFTSPEDVHSLTKSLINVDKQRSAPGGSFNCTNPYILVNAPNTNCVKNIADDSNIAMDEIVASLDGNNITHTIGSANWIIRSMDIKVSTVGADMSTGSIFMVKSIDNIRVEYKTMDKRGVSHAMEAQYNTELSRYLETLGNNNKSESSVKRVKTVY
jgi:hypothetical protein